jgi:CRISPR-associated protein Csb2
VTTTLLIKFPWGRYHATPWGRHVNEGAVEMPPSPWRLLRSLYAVWRTRLPHLSEADVAPLLTALAVPPVFYAPAHTIAHTRHYYPDTAHRTGKLSTDRTVDAFAILDRDATLGVEWHVDLSPEQRETLTQLAKAMPYFGRAESLCEAFVVDTWDLSTCDKWVPLDVADDIGRDADITTVLAPDLPLVLDSLTARPVDVRRAGLLFPTGSRLLAYQRVSSATRPVPTPRTDDRAVTGVRFSVMQAGLPARTDALIYTDLLRQAALSIYGKQQEKRRQPLTGPSLLAGKTATEEALANQHQHAHYLPPIFTGQRLTDLVVWTPGGLPEHELTALTAVRKLSSPTNRDWRLVLRVAGVGDIQDIAPELCGPARTWQSVMPYTPSRHPKPDADWTAFLAEDVTRELTFRGHPAAEVVALSDSWAEYRRYRPTARQRHNTRQGFSNRPSAFLKLTFPEQVHGPLTLGHLSHFGLGLFQPAS